MLERVLKQPLRGNRGGCPRCVRNVSNYFFKEPTHLNTIHWRKGKKHKQEESWTQKISNQNLADKPLYLLTDSNTVSASEEFVYNLKNQNRVLVIGEKTRGACNPGGLFQINGNLFVFISDGKSINPISGTSWTGGIEPDVKCDGEEALTKTLELIQNGIN